MDKTILKNIFVSKYEPQYTDTLWLDLSEGDNGVLKAYVNGNWVKCNSTIMGQAIRTEDLEPTDNVVTFRAVNTTMTCQLVGTQGTISGYISNDNTNWTLVNTIFMDSTNFTFQIDVPSAGVYVKLTTTGTITSGTVVTSVVIAEG